MPTPYLISEFTSLACPAPRASRLSRCSLPRLGPAFRLGAHSRLPRRPARGPKRHPNPGRGSVRKVEQRGRRCGGPAAGCRLGFAWMAWTRASAFQHSRAHLQRRPALLRGSSSSFWPRILPQGLQDNCWTHTALRCEARCSALWDRCNHLRRGLRRGLTFGTREQERDTRTWGAATSQQRSSGRKHARTCGSGAFG